MDGAELGTVICDTYMEGCEMYGTEDETTLSVVDLGKIGAVLTAYDNMGKEALSYACEDPSFFPASGEMRNMRRTTAATQRTLDIPIW